MHNSEFYVHCRIGSLETLNEELEVALIVHCRIGSLES